MSVSVSFDPTVFERAFEGMVDDFATACQDAFDDPVWRWPTTTRRRSGETVASPRNIVDLGTLRASQQRPQVAGLNASITWNAEHAAAVFLGAVYEKRAASMPARHLPRFVAQNFDWEGAFKKHAGSP